MAEPAVAPQRVEYGQGIGQALFGLVVVGNDHVEAEGHGVVDFVKGLHPAVEGDEHFGAELDGPIDARLREAVSFAVAVGNVGLSPPSPGFQGEGADRHRRGAVDVVVAKEKHEFALGAGKREAFGGFGHSGHVERVHFARVGALNPVAHFVEVAKPAQGEQFSHGPVDLLFEGRDGLGVGFGGQRPPLASRAAHDSSRRWDW